VLTFFFIIIIKQQGSFFMSWGENFLFRFD